MKNVIDSVVGYFSPRAGLDRVRARMAMNVIQRKYDVSSNSRRNSFGFARKTTGAEEVSIAENKAAAAGQELCRNNPLALRAKRVWSNNVVGAGITMEATDKNGSDVVKFNEVWDDLMTSTNIDFEGHNTLYGLQHLWISTVIESGGVFIRRHVNKSKEFPMQLQTIEQGYLDKAKNKGTAKGVIIDGIQFGVNGQLEGYWFLMEKTLTNKSSQAKSKFHKASNIIHIFRKDRVGQHLGITWFGATATTFKNYSIYQDAKLVQQQIAACLALIVEESPALIGGTKVTEDLPDQLEPASIYYVEHGQTVTTVTPPKADSSNAFDVATKRDLAAGLGLTYEQLSGDYSLVNFASGRMGKNEFFNELDVVQQHLMLPALNKVFGWFVDIFKIDNISVINKTSKFKPDWTFPARSTVNPQEEFDVLMSKVRHGMMSPRKAAKILGERLDKIVVEWKKDKDLFGDLPFDIDPSIFAPTGNQLDDNDAASANRVDRPKVNPETKEKGKEDV